jgi:transposase
MFNNLYDKVRRKPERIYGANMSVNPRNGRKQILYDEKGYKIMRPAVERFNSWLKTFRRVIIRYERLAIMFQAIVTFACIMMHMRYGL